MAYPSLISITTELKNVFTRPMILEATMYLGIIPVVRIAIPPGEVKYICYGILPVEENPDRPVLVSVSMEGAAEGEKKFILSTIIRDNAKLVLNYEDGNVTVMPVEGNIMARIWCIFKLRRCIAGIWKHMRKTEKKLNQS